MSELREQREKELDARDERARVRKIELAPVFAHVALLGERVYETLRPIAVHVASAERDNPLRHQQVHGLVGGGVGDVVSDYLMIGFGDNHSLLLYNDFDTRRGKWKFNRTTRVEDEALKTEDMKLSEIPKAYQNTQGVYDFEVSRYKYAEKIGWNPMHDDFVCSYFDAYEDAESYLGLMEADLNRAITDFS